MSKLKVGVVGLGIGCSHIRGFQSHPDVEVVGVADIDEKRLAEKAEEFGIKGRYSSMDKLISAEKPDIISVALPNKLHKPFTIRALEAGCHVLCEKPMAMNAAEADEMNRAAARAGRRLMINFSFRFNDQSYALKKEVESGILGDLYFARTIWLRRRGIPKFGSWFSKKELAGGGPIIDLGVHRLDLALWLMGYPEPEWVMAQTFDHIGGERGKREGIAFDVEDMGVAMIRFRNGAMLELEASWASNIKQKEEMETRILGTMGGLVQKNCDETYRFEAELYLEREGRLYDMKLHPPVPGAHSSMYHFAESIINNTPHTATGEEGRTVMSILDAVYESALSGEPVRISG